MDCTIGRDTGPRTYLGLEREQSTATNSARELNVPKGGGEIGLAPAV